MAKQNETKLLLGYSLVILTAHAPGQYMSVWLSPGPWPYSKLDVRS